MKKRKKPWKGLSNVAVVDPMDPGKLEGKALGVLRG